MATPTALYNFGDYVTIETSTSLGISGQTNIGSGTVRQIGLYTKKVKVDDIVLFQLDKAGVFKQGTSFFTIVSEIYIFLKTIPA